MLDQLARGGGQGSLHPLGEADADHKLLVLMIAQRQQPVSQADMPGVGPQLSVSAPIRKGLARLAAPTPPVRSPLPVRITTSDCPTATDAYTESRRPWWYLRRSPSVLS